MVLCTAVPPRKFFVNIFAKMTVPLRCSCISTLKGLLQLRLNFDLALIQLRLKINKLIFESRLERLRSQSEGRGRADQMNVERPGLGFCGQKPVFCRTCGLNRFKPVYTGKNLKAVIIPI